MTRLLITGYETGDANELGSTNSGGSGTVTVVTSTPTPQSPGSYCLKCTGAASGGNAWKTYSLGGNKTEVWIRFTVYLHLTVAGEYLFAYLNDSAAGGQACLTYTAADSLIRARQTNGTGGTLIGTSSLTMTQDAWHLIEWRHQMTSTSAGTTELWVDGTRVINVSGDNTGTANVNVASLVLGVIWGATASTTYFAFDDIAVNDTAGTINNGRIYDGRVVLLKPTGAGSNTNQTRGGTDSGANWSQVDELPPSMTDYVYSATAGTRDTYALQDLPAGAWAVNCCEVLAYGQNNDTNPGSLGLTVKSGATTNEGSAQAMATTAQYFRQLYETDPATTAAWSTSAVNALEAGTTVR